MLGLIIIGLVLITIYCHIKASLLSVEIWPILKKKNKKLYEKKKLNWFSLMENKDTYPKEIHELLVQYQKFKFLGYAIPILIVLLLLFTYKG